MKWCVALLLLVAAAGAVTGQETAREIWDSGFRQKRPVPSGGPAPKRSAPVVDYRVGAGPAPTRSDGSTLVGLTIWRLRTPDGTDSAPRLLVQDSPGVESIAYVAERMPHGQGLSVGDRIRLGIEVATRGYLYVIDREGYADGSSGPPHLIYPARNLNDGDNRVEPGRLIEIPGQGDPVPALRVIRQNARHVREDIEILLTREPLPGVSAGEREVRLPEDLVAAWERRWGSEAATVRLDLSPTSAVGLWSAPERESGLSQRLLTQDDPMPSSLYQVANRSDGALVRIPLPIK